MGKLQIDWTDISCIQYTARGSFMFNSNSILINSSYCNSNSMFAAQNHFSILYFSVFSPDIGPPECTA